MIFLPFEWWSRKLNSLVELVKNLPWASVFLHCSAPPSLWGLYTHIAQQWRDKDFCLGMFLCSFGLAPVYESNIRPFSCWSPTLWTLSTFSPNELTGSLLRGPLIDFSPPSSTLGPNIWLSFWSSWAQNISQNFKSRNIKNKTKTQKMICWLASYHLVTVLSLIQKQIFQFSYLSPKDSI